MKAKRFMKRMIMVFLLFAVVISITGPLTIHAKEPEQKVVRVGGDEFIALLGGEDYANQENLLKQFEKQIMDNKKEDKIVVAFGSSRFDPDQDESIITVFERADENMYQKKKELKNTPSKAD